MTWLAIVSITSGRRSGLMAVAGIATGLLTIGLAAALGAASLINSSPLAYEILRWAGVAYLFYLAWGIWQNAEEADPTGASSHASYFRMGLITNLLNPKAALFYLTVPPQFLSSDAPVLASLVTMTLIYVTVATLIHAAIVMFADQAGKQLKSEENVTTLRKVMAILLACVAIWMLISTART